MPSPGNEALKSPSRHRRSKTGCQQCRQRKRKCDEQHPRCLACVDRDLPCDWRRSSITKQAPRRQAGYNKDFAVPLEMRSHVTVFAVPSTTIQESLLSYFRHNCPLWLTTGISTGGTHCADIVMPVALRSPLVLNCVLAMAAGDLSKYRPASSGLVSQTQSFYGQAVTGIHSAIGAGFESDDAILVAIILLCVHEAVNYTATDRILPHVVAAATLCHNRHFNVSADTHLRGLLLELFCYIFTLTGFAQGHKLPLHLALPAFSSPYLLDRSFEGILLGQQCRKILAVILRVSIITSHSSLSNEATMGELGVLEAEVESLPISKSSGEATDQDAMAELYRLACLIHIKKLLDSELQDESEVIQDLLGQFAVILDALPPTSPVNNISCWPLVVAGMSAVAVTHRRLIVGRLWKMHQVWRSDIVKNSAAFLSKKWKQDKAWEGQCGQTMQAKETLLEERSSIIREAFKIPML